VGTKNKVGKAFDCVAFKRKAQERIYRKIRHLSAEQEAAYFDRATKAGPFAELWNELVAKGRKTTISGKLARGPA
jgi:hypothetical protein